MLTERTLQTVEVFKNYLEQKGRNHVGSMYDASLLSYYNGIMTALDGLATAEDLEEYVITMVSLVKSGADEIFNKNAKRRN